MQMPIRQPLPLDGRQSETALAVARGTGRLLLSLGFCCVSELPLPSGRRADLVALRGDSTIWIVEIKSSIADFRADQKWMDYRLHCDRLFFATTMDVPCEIFPPDTGLIVNVSVVVGGGGVVPPPITSWGLLTPSLEVSFAAVLLVDCTARLTRPVDFTTDATSISAQVDAVSAPLFPDAAPTAGLFS